MLSMRPFRHAVSLLLLPALVHCGSDGGSPAGSVEPGDYKGLVTTGSGTSVLEVTFSGTMATQSLHALGTSAGGQYAANGTSTPIGGGIAVTLTGSYDPATGTLTLSGTSSSGAYSFAGKASGSHLSGDYTSPSGSGTFSLLPAISGAVTLYCGTYSGDASGVWNIAVDASGTAVGGHCDGSECGALEGKVSDSGVSLRDPTSPDVSGTGNKSGSNLNGSWTGGGGQAHGTWQGSASGCGG